MANFPMQSALDSEIAMPDTPELLAAKQKLEGHGGYDWLLNGQIFWTVEQVIKELGELGWSVSTTTATRWFNSLPHTQGSSGPGGLRASKNDLIIYFAGQMGRRTKDAE